MRWLWPMTPRRLRRLVLARKARPVVRILLGLTAAFACGVVLGVGVAAVLTPQGVETAAHVAGAAGERSQRSDSDSAPYAVEVRVRQEGGSGDAAAPAPVPEAAQAPAPTSPAEAGAKLDTGVRLVAKPAPQPPAEEAPVVPGTVAAPAAPASGSDPQTSDMGVPPSVRAEPQPAAEPLPQDAQPVPTDGDRLAFGPAASVVPPPPPAADEAPAPNAMTALPTPTAPVGPELAALPMAPGDAAWIRNAVKLPEAPRDAAIAIIIDDMGIDQKRSKRAIGLPAPVTLSFIPYGYHLTELVAAAREAGHEVMLHLPMEPMDPEADPGPNALRTTVSIEENHRRIVWALTRFDGFVGLNNHMGSKFTAWRPGMELVMQQVQERGLLFVDSFTNNESVGYALARQRKLPSASRDVFIDHDITRVAIGHSLRELERIARRRGYAVGIAHPHDLSREMLKSWIEDAKSRGFDFVPISYIVRRSMKTG